ncbi:MAG: hypothetical protein IKX89_07565 [Firmicutes bacterium]|nr:hypothetical protein [Bacillota bacterium]
MIRTRSRRKHCMLLAALLLAAFLLGAAVLVFAEGEERAREPLERVTCKAIVTTYGDYQNNFIFTASDTGEELQGYCLEANKDATIQPGWTASASPLSGSLRVLMYLAHTRGYTATNFPWNYIVARVADALRRDSTVYVTGNAQTQAAGQALLDEVLAYDESNVPKSFKAYRISYNSNRQDVVTYRFEVVPGKVRVTKTSTDASVSSCSGYSLAGAVFGVYRTEAEASAATDSSRGDPLALLTTGTDGKTPESGELDPGTYYIKELRAPAGFAPESGVRTVLVEDGETAEVSVADAPNTDPIGVLLRKLDKQTGSEV